MFPIALFHDQVLDVEIQTTVSLSVRESKLSILLDKCTVYVVIREGGDKKAALCNGTGEQSILCRGRDPLYRAGLT